MLLAVFGLPPAQLSLAEGGHDVADAVAVAVVFRPRLAGVAGEAFGVLLEVTNNAVVLGAPQATGGGGGEVGLAPDQEVPGGGVTAALLTSWLPLTL